MRIKLATKEQVDGLNSKLAKMEGEVEEVKQLITPPPKLPLDTTNTPGKKIPFRQGGLEEYYRTGWLPRMLQPEEGFAFYGEVPASEFITGDDLALELGLTAGVSTNSDTEWLKFMYKGNIQFISKKAIRTQVSWTELYNKSLIYGGTPILLKDNLYLVRLPRGIGEDIQKDPKETLTDINQREAYHNSEWNLLFCTISDGADPTKQGYWAAPENLKFPTPKIAPVYENLLEFNPTPFQTLCQEQVATWNGEIRKLTRGLWDASGVANTKEDSKSVVVGWRPVLELVDFNNKSFVRNLTRNTEGFLTLIEREGVMTQLLSSKNIKTLEPYEEATGELVPIKGRCSVELVSGETESYIDLNVLLMEGVFPLASRIESTGEDELVYYYDLGGN